MSEDNAETIYIKELNPDIIAPSTKQLGEPESWGGSKLIICGKPGCFVKDTKILMFDGTMKNVQDVNVGDVVMGDDSTPRNVIETCHNSDEMFKVIPNKGEPYTVNKQHKLVLKSSGFNRYNKSEIVEITVENYLKETTTFKNRMKIFRNSVEFPEQKVSIDPYLLGTQIGNGGNLISHEYIANTKTIRLQFLAGLLDTDGSYNDDSLGYEISHKNERILDDLIFIARSLGFLISKTKNGILIVGNIDEIPCKIKRKIARERIAIKDHLVSGFILESQGEGEYFGFTLDGNHRFLLGTCDVVRNTGKSTLIASLLYAKKHIFPVAVAFSGSEDSNGFYRKILPSTFVFNEYNEEQIKSFIRRQKIAKQHLPNPWAVILLDDCTDDARVFNTPLQQGMYKRGRHWSMWYIVSLQYAMDVKPVIRTNVDGVFILREPILKNRRSLWENYASVVPDFNLFCQLLDQLTDDFCCLYISNQTKSNDWKDCVFWYKAPKIPEDWKFGCPEYMQFHEDRFNQDYVDPFD
jgi:hypothetical protein